MKTYTIALFLILMSGLSGQTAPENLRATAIDDHGFTLRWAAVDDAIDYELELKELILREGFDEDTFPASWEEDNTYLNTNYPDWSPYDNNFLAMKTVKSSLVSPPVTNPQEIRFWAYISGSYITYNLTLDIQYADVQDNPENLDWQTIETLSGNSGKGDITDVKTEYIIDSDLTGDYQIRFELNTDIGALLLDEIYFIGSSRSSMPNYNAHRINDLAPNTDYVCRVRARYSEGDPGPYSDWITVTTEAENYAATGSAINGAPAQIDLHEDNHYVSINPNVADADYSVQYSQTETTRTYTITCETDAFVGDYTINHPGFHASGIQITGAEPGNAQLDQSSSSFSINSYNGKGEIKIDLIGSDTLPVEFGSMFINSISGGTVDLQWFTYSESDCQGYYVLRGSEDRLSQAVRISGLIQAQNSSDGETYIYTDNNPEAESYYWVESLSFSGEHEYHGPVFYQGSESDSSPPPIPIQNSISSFPNPFNPSTTIRYGLAQDSMVELSIYNIRGTKVFCQSRHAKDAGQYKLIWNAGKLPSGVYLIRLKTEDNCLTHKMVLTK